MRGISMSSVRTSGSSRRIMSRATNGSPAPPTTSMSGSPFSESASSFRTIAESSTMRTLIALVATLLRDCQLDPDWLAVEQPRGSARWQGDANHDGMLQLEQRLRRDIGQPSPADHVRKLAGKVVDRLTILRLFTRE